MFRFIIKAALYVAPIVIGAVSKKFSFFKEIILPIGFEAIARAI